MFTLEESALLERMLRTVGWMLMCAILLSLLFAVPAFRARRVQRGVRARQDGGADIATHQVDSPQTH